jgi:hypothetical protein
MSFSTARVPSLHLRHLHWLVSVQSVDDLHYSRVLQVLLLSHGDAAPIVETLQVYQHNFAYIPQQRYKLNYCRHRRLRACRGIRRVYSFRDHSITTDRSRALCVLGTPNNALCIVVINTTSEKNATLSGGEVHLEY